MIIKAVIIELGAYQKTGAVCEALGMPARGTKQRTRRPGGAPRSSEPNNETKLTCFAYFGVNGLFTLKVPLQASTTSLDVEAGERSVV